MVDEWVAIAAAVDRITHPTDAPTVALHPEASRDLARLEVFYDERGLFSPSFMAGFRFARHCLARQSLDA